MTKEEKLILIKQVFSPASPIKQKDFFFGRINQLNKIADAINEEGQHAILYGDRGVGKTSLANIMATAYTNLHPVKITCGRLDNFKILWQNALDNIQFSKTTKGIGFNPQQTKEIVQIGNQTRNIPELRPSHIVQILNSLPASRLLFIFDEFDNISTKKARATFADLIKSLSDNNINSTIVLVGIADSIESLIGNHQSLERCLKQVKMPKMKNEECEEIITTGLQRLGLTIDKKVAEQIIEFSSGFPHYVHLLCKFGAKEIIENEKTNFSPAYLNIAIRQGIENTSEQLRISYRRAILTSNSSSKWRDLLFACAVVKIDEFNAFTISEVVKSYNQITDKDVKNGSITYNLNQLVTENRGEVLTKLGKGMSTRYMFKNPMMRAFVKLKINAGE
ncbi:nSTAND1 domain-containing NTPase [Tenacibaculum finnmarkense]|uniref:nSTAND1 domain-containing NTPase n=1 Tax=Tenacibaculum finnmarkense TaxID=2781243 RepID=UPI001EFA8629|nr:ATP-binding protein [Tenacibaculum finnmarkense]MCG8796687.1 ATP-binding protein [Tenacibaculum finnmarkense]MCG8799017.1 ATP-binding protein [Tenacibaculum finnmarkense]